MVKKILYAISRIEDENKKRIYCEDLDKTDYETKYKGKLTCIKGCPARIKFTERKNNKKFFSTWNKDGELHEEGCPYRVEYTGKGGRKKLAAFYENVELTDEVILRRLQAKMASILREYTDEEIVDPPKGSLKMERIGDAEAMVIEGVEDGEKSSTLPNIRHEDAEYISTDDIGCRKSVYGFIDNVQLEQDRFGKKFAYFNLATKHSQVNIAFPEAFYSNEFSNGVEEFETFIIKVKRMVEKSPKKVMVIAYGEITKKKKNRKGVNVNIISPNRILVDNKTYKQVLIERV